MTALKLKSASVQDNVIEIIQLVEDTPPQKSSQDVIAVGDHFDSKAVLDFAIDYHVRQIVQTSSLSVDLEMKAAALMITNPEAFLQFPISSILNASNVSASSEAEFLKAQYSFSRRSDLQAVFAAMDIGLRKVGANNSLIDDVLLVVGELFSNSLYNAPYLSVDDRRSGISRQVSDDQTEMERPGRCFLGASDDCLVVGCEDSYGTLNVMHSFEQVRKCFIQGAGAVIDLDGDAGAGIGSYLVHKIATGFYAGVRENQKTVVCCSFPLKVGNLKRTAMPKNLHFFQLPSK